ncbi:hypothetical protein GSI_14334 [Ganoderma sinense ZZ0214-1]|uniref:Uncharacterized protein n=1 Tax=Ganoderma sinense ZZ0214-1 TaxID=1077348 RepID=A0A2G8RNE5_9APHY|nr:hypothetical protein GSI_14334 [Ganoderma sinense ZZ0214-1]
MFYYNGHGIQIDTQNKDEEDGCDEAIVPYAPDGKVDHILDDEAARPLRTAPCLFTYVIVSIEVGTTSECISTERATPLHDSLLQGLEADASTQGTASGTNTAMGRPSRVILVQIPARTLQPPPRRRTHRTPRRASSTPVRGNGVWVHLQCDEPESFLQCGGFSC